MAQRSRVMARSVRGDDDDAYPGRQENTMVARNDRGRKHQWS
jgi:hypothetical protein